MSAEIGIIGGSGFYSLLSDAETVEVETEYGAPSSPITVGDFNGRRVAFIARHGAKHTIPPHKVPYKANIAALDSLGVKRIVTTNAVGSLSPKYKPGDFALLDQFVNMTHGRDDTFFHSNPVVHISTADPYCHELRGVASRAFDKLHINAHKTATVVVVNGPRFSTKAESRFYSSMGFDLINMTQYPEVVLAKEKRMCYLGIAIVTDYDVGLEGQTDVEPVTFEQVSKIFGENMSRIKGIMGEIVSSTPKEQGCNCRNSLDGAVVSN
ncbi:MAG: S-methyl-5'-thioadenosine phosphorylase [Candidatus Micrarchaeota archaeon]|nr:S-methyl-5'-thioadenosine phosphorylase [Candidatus Micrarchaeota archaeon]